MNKNEDVKYEVPEDENDAKCRLALELEYLEVRVGDVQDDLDKLRADVVEARDNAETVCDPVTLLETAADRMCRAGCPSKRCGGVLKRGNYRYTYDEDCPAASIWKELDEALLAERPPYGTPRDEKVRHVENRIVFRVTAFGNGKEQEKMCVALAAVKGVELVEVESVEKPKAKAEPQDGGACPT